MWERGKRYEAIEIDGLWYVIDHKHPEEVHPQPNKDEATENARVWNVLTEVA